MRQKNGIEPLTQTTVYPDTIWRERKQNGEIKTERRKGGKERKRETFIDPSKYILQTTKHFSGATIRGQALSQDHPFSPLCQTHCLLLSSVDEQEKAIVIKTSSWFRHIWFNLQHKGDQI